MPIGTHRWYFSTGCNDLGKPWRLLNLHEDVDFPGNFCCDDGYCIDSELVCDNVPDCGDKSDEAACENLSIMLKPIITKILNKKLFSLNSNLVQKKVTFIRNHRYFVECVMLS